jgi:hypothetical protein
VDKTVSKLQKLGGGLAMVTGIISESGRRRAPFPDAKLRTGDVLLIEGAPDASTRWSARRPVAVRPHAGRFDAG